MLQLETIMSLPLFENVDTARKEAMEAKLKAVMERVTGGRTERPVETVQ